MNETQLQSYCNHIVYQQVDDMPRPPSVTQISSNELPLVDENHRAESAAASAVSVAESHQSTKSSSTRHSSATSLRRHDSNSSLQLDLRPASDSPKRDHNRLYTTSERGSSRQETPDPDEAGDHSRSAETPSSRRDQFESDRTISP